MATPRLFLRLRPRDTDSLVVPWWVPPAFLALALVLVPWTAWLFLSLPMDAEANHWALAWAGFDVGLGLSLAATAGLVWRRSPLSEMSATVTATILVCDAWFDVLTARGWEVLQAGLLAALVELPLAVFCLWIARNVERVMEDARPYLLRAGFQIHGRRLVPPEDVKASGP